jgi:hypothetical protein
MDGELGEIVVKKNVLQRMATGFKDMTTMNARLGGQQFGNLKMTHIGSTQNTLRAIKKLLETGCRHMLGIHQNT